MPNSTVRIGNLRLRIPGLSRDDAKLLGHEVSQLVAKQLTSSAAGTIDHVHISIPNGVHRSTLAQTIAANIARRIG